VSKSEVDEVLKNVSVATSQEKILEFDKAVNDLINDESKKEDAVYVMDGVVRGWKEEYIKYCKI
jgi:hypothetical protein